MNGVELINDERRRQIERGYTPEADVRYGGPELAAAAVGILLNHTRGTLADSRSGVALAITDHVQAKHRVDKIRQLQIAGALIAAEIDRLQYRNANRGTLPPATAAPRLA